jgi:hypothetical protein
MRAAVLVASFCLVSGAAFAQQTCTTRADGSFNCTTPTSPAALPAAAPASVRDRRVFQPDDTGLLRIPTQDGEMLYHCDILGPCKQIGLNPQNR